MNINRHPKARKNVKLDWCSNLAYAIGLITSDGNLRKNAYEISIRSVDKELIENFRKSLGIKNKIGLYKNPQRNTKLCYYVSFKDVLFYEFLLNIGLSPAKSKTIKKVLIPDELFPDFLRGLFDGDGSFHTFWDRRWPNSFAFQLSFASASRDFLEWLKKDLTKLYGVKGFIVKGKGVFAIRYVKGDSEKLYDIMYHRLDVLFLTRKYIKVRDALEYNELIKKPR